MKSILKNKKNYINLLLGLITILGIALRFCCLDKSTGLWYDELVSYKEASLSNVLQVVFYTLKTDVHMPLYLVLLHFWGKLLSFSDYHLRLFSAFCGMLTVICAFFIGKELKSIKTGLICSSIFAVNSFLIFYSQEVRLYGFLMLLSTLNLFFIIKIKNYHNNIYNYWGFVVSTLALLYTYTIGFIFVVSQTAAFILYCLFHVRNKDDKRLIRNISIFVLISIFFSIPVFAYLLSHKLKYLHEINGYYCDWSSLFVIIQDWFSPVQTGLFNNPIHYMKTLFYNLNFSVIIFIFIPVILAIFGFVNSFKKDKFSFVILSGALIFLLAEIIAFKFTNFKILARYTALVVPNILILTGYGFSLINYNKWLKLTIISMFLGINLFYLLFAPNASFRIDRNGFRSFVLALNSCKINDGDFVVVWNRKEVLDKYNTKKLNTLSLLRDFAYTSEIILYNQAKLNALPLEERKLKLRKYFASDTIPQNNIILMDFINSHMKKGQKFIITTTKQFDSYNQESFSNLVQNDNEFNKISYNDLLTIHSVIDLKKLCYKRLHFIKRVEKNGFVITVFQK